MKKNFNPMAILLFFTILLCVGSLVFFSYDTYQQIRTTEQDLNTAMVQVTAKQQEFKTDVETFTQAVTSQEATLKQKQQAAQTAKQKKTKERAEVVEEEEVKPSVFSQESSFSDSDSSNGIIIGIDPGHQSEAIDMSAQEPNGPGSSEMKTKASTGTQGTFSGLPEYQLNLSVSLKLKDILEQRGYQVVMTRTNNETAISNKERAEYVAAQGADICVRIHANGDDSGSASGALTMCPSPSNPYVSQLYDASNKLSQCIINSYCAATGFGNLGIIYTDTMTGINWSTIPVTIVEMGFMTSQNDDLQMCDDSFQQIMATGIADGIDAYYAQ